jgi:hypothetical protein
MNHDLWQGRARARRANQPDDVLTEGLQYIQIKQFPEPHNPMGS